MTWTRERGAAGGTLSEADRFVLGQTGTESGAAVWLTYDVRPSWPAASASGRCTWLWFSAHDEMPRFSVESDASQLPPWLDPVLISFARLLALPPDWDSYGARPIEIRSVNAALKFLIPLMRHATPAPAVVPLAAGGVQLEWHVAGVDLEIAVHGPDRVEVVFDERSGASFDDEFPAALSRLRPVMDRLSR